MVAINHDLDHLDASAGHESVLHKLVIRQQPKRSRVGCISERVDRRPVDPPPIIQLVMDKQSQGAGTDPDEPSYTLSPHFIMRATLVDKDDEKEISRIRGDTVPALSGMVVSSLHTLCDLDMVQGAYFVFGDLSVRLEGSFKLRFDLFEILGQV
ncbi:hypothetical protein H4219_000168 [Mycoemilia scoparia]|uniref:Velvet domain-containing protein n=1 Tax=Mycoemilia scoparia TaxID=417184 RepID=A0A9W8A6V3_9FUNG|nr:hypothetical protein H4219_000168 [Mycoemilia scoparia]